MPDRIEDLDISNLPAINAEKKPDDEGGFRFNEEDPGNKAVWNALKDGEEFAVYVNGELAKIGQKNVDKIDTSKNQYNLGLEIFNTILYGLGDEVKGAAQFANAWVTDKTVGTDMLEGRSLGDFQQEIRDDQAEWRRDNPGQSIAGTVAGIIPAVMTGTAGLNAVIRGGTALAPRVFPQALNAAKNFPRALTEALPTGTQWLGRALGSKVVKSIPSGIGYGAAYGAGEGSPGQRLESAERGGIYGAAFAPAVPLASAFAKSRAGEMIGGGLKRVGQRIFPKAGPDASVKAQREIARAIKMETDQVGPYTKRVEKRLGQVGEGASILDAAPGVALHRLVSKAAEGYGAARNRLANFIGHRNNRKEARLLNTVDDVFEDSGKPLDQILSGAKISADKNYKAAFTAPGNQRLMSQEIENILSTSQGRNALYDALEDFMAGQNPRLTKEQVGGIKKLVDMYYRAISDPRKRTPIVGFELPLEVLDMVKRNLWTSGEGAKAKSREILNKNLSGALAKELDRLDTSPKSNIAGVGSDENMQGSYNIARSIYSGRKRMEASYINGEKFLSMSASDIKKYLAGKDAAEVNLFISGAVKTIQLKISETKGKPTFFDSSEMMNRMKVLIPNKEARDRFVKAITREKAFARTEREVSRGPAYAREGIGEIPGAAGVVAGTAVSTRTGMGHPMMVAGRARNYIEGIAHKMLVSKETDLEIVRSLTKSTNRAELEELLRKIGSGESEIPEGVSPQRFVNIVRNALTALHLTEREHAYSIEGESPNRRRVSAPLGDTSFRYTPEPMKEVTNPLYEAISNWTPPNN